MRNSNGVRSFLERKRRHSIDVPGKDFCLMGKLIIGIVAVGLAMTIAVAAYVITLSSCAGCACPST